MRQRIFVVMASAFLISTVIAAAQNSIDALQNELTEAKQQHDEMTSKVVTNFFAAVDAGMASPDDALTIYTDPNGINGAPPDPIPVATVNEHESVSEENEREAIDKQNLARMAIALQLHCGILHFAGLFALQPGKVSHHDEWVEWLKTAAPLYVELQPPYDRSVSSAPPPRPPVKKDQDRDRDQDQEEAPKKVQRPPPWIPNDLKNRSVQDSLFTKYFGFTACNGKDQGGWSVRRIPEFYRAEVLEPLRAKPSQATLEAWDQVIAMANSDEPDNDRWNQVVYPGLVFDRACDAYLAAPSTESLEVLVDMIKANPTGPNADAWITRVQGFLSDYRASHGSAPAPSSAPATGTDTSAPAPTPTPPAH